METRSQGVNPLFEAYRPRLARLINPINRIDSSKLANASEIAKFDAMAELTNLTDRISHLRDRKGGSAIVRGGGSAPPTPRKVGKRSPERRFATDYFMIFVYALLGIAVCTQFVLIAWLDVV